MAASIADLDFLAPMFAALPEDEKLKALAVGAAFRPHCLPEGLQDTAQLYYAAWLLEGRARQLRAMESPPVPVGITSEKEGDLQRTYGNNGVTDVNGFFDQWHRLNKLCGVGAITVGMPPLPYGTRQGY